MINMTTIVLNESSAPRQSKCDAPAESMGNHDSAGAAPADRVAPCSTAGDVIVRFFCNFIDINTMMWF